VNLSGIRCGWQGIDHQRLSPVQRSVPACILDKSTHESRASGEIPESPSQAGEVARRLRTDVPGVQAVVRLRPDGAGPTSTAPLMPVRAS
jgi:hypothetical protein